MGLSRLEVVAPAGNAEKLNMALRYGADGVYLGGPALNLRAFSDNFGMEELARACELTHGFGARAYVTLNVFAGCDDAEAAKAYARELAAAGADALIVSDIGLLTAVRECVPDMEIHLSTQANCTNHLAARAYHDMGVRRIILARELSLEEIKKIRDNTPPTLELEAFAHGAMCMSYSGRCQLSRHMTGRDANMGECAQPCRWEYTIMEKKREGELFMLQTDDRGSYILSSKDLCMIEHLEDMKKAGITAIKIEGRMKSAYYAATVTNAYRLAAEGCADMEGLLREVLSVSHREYCTGFYYGRAELGGVSGAYIQDCDFVGVVVGTDEDGNAVVEQRNAFAAGEVLEVLSPGKLGRSVVIGRMEDENGTEITAAPHPQMRVTLLGDYGLKEYDILRRRKG